MKVKVKSDKGHLYEQFKNTIDGARKWDKSNAPIYLTSSKTLFETENKNFDVIEILGRVGDSVKDLEFSCRRSLERNVHQHIHTKVKTGVKLSTPCFN